MNLNLIVDTRENKIKCIFEQNSEKYSNFNISYKACDVGDFVYSRTHSSESEDPSIELVIERKTISDLYSSINDGRYREQKMRLMANYSRNQILFIIENDIGINDSRYKIVMGAILNSMLRDKLRIIRSRNIIETVYILTTIYKKLNDNPNWTESAINGDAINGNAINTDYTSAIKVRKKDNMTPEVCQLAQLSLIPGVSINYSKVILAEYHTLSALILTYKQLDTTEEKEDLLKDLVIQTNTGKTRRLGKVLSVRIFNYLMI